MKVTQWNVLLNFLEKVLKQNNTDDLVRSASLISKASLDTMSLQELDKTLEDIPSAGDITVSEHFVVGWCPSLWLDLACIMVMAEVGKILTGSGNVVKMSKHLQTLVNSIVNNQSKIDARVRCYFMSMTGVQNNEAKEIWLSMTAHNKDRTAVSTFHFDEESVTADVKKVKDAAESRDADAMADCLMDLFVEPVAAHELRSLCLLSHRFLQPVIVRRRQQ